MNSGLCRAGSATSARGHGASSTGVPVDPRHPSLAATSSLSGKLPESTEISIVRPLKACFWRPGTGAGVADCPITLPSCLGGPEIDLSMPTADSRTRWFATPGLRGSWRARSKRRLTLDPLDRSGATEWATTEGHDLQDSRGPGLTPSTAIDDSGSPRLP